MSGRKYLDGKISSTGMKVAIVAGRFNAYVVDRLVDGAVDAFVRTGADESDVTVVRVPGAFEIPQAARRVVRSGRYDAVVCVGAVIRGATPHFDYVASEAAKGVGQVAMESDIPVTFGVLTTDTVEQAIDRAGAKAGNKGFDAAMAAIELFNVYRALEPDKGGA